MKGIQTPLVEVSMFLCWAFIPYYICDGVDWSGIVAIVAAGFFMDIYVIGSKKEQMQPGSFDSSNSMLDNGNNSNVVQSRVRLGVFSQEGFLSTKAKNHIRFVTEINATLMETAIFAYLGIFLLNKRYHWSFLIALIGIVSCVASRSLTVVFSSFLSNMITKIGIVGQRRFRDSCSSGPIATKSRPPTTEIDSRMQLVLIFAGLRGAMSFALVETVPMFDPTTGEGSRFKPELKAMTSSCIFFTIFVLGGYTYYLLDQMGMGPMAKSETDVEMVSLINGSSGEDEDDENPWAGKDESSDGLIRRKPFFCPDQDILH
jgi:NhaP-type Na+/H+ or K+/H+ antiporter